MSPEEAFFAGAIGKRVSVSFVGFGPKALTEERVLMWVDKYSLGLRLSGGRVLLTYKHAIEAIGVLGDAPPDQATKD